MDHITALAAIGIILLVFFGVTFYLRRFMGFWQLLWWLLVVHALCDFSLQTDAMARGKNRHNITTPPPGQRFVPCWYYWLSAHALIHGGSVSLVTDSVWAGVYATVVHWVVDFLKCDNWTTPHSDQLIHGITILAIAVAWS